MPLPLRRARAQPLRGRPHSRSSGRRPLQPDAASATSAASSASLFLRTTKFPRVTTMHNEIRGAWQHGRSKNAILICLSNL